MDKEKATIFIDTGTISFEEFLQGDSYEEDGKRLHPDDEGDILRLDEVDLV